LTYGTSDPRRPRAVHGVNQKEEGHEPVRQEKPSLRMSFGRIIEDQVEDIIRDAGKEEIWPNDVFARQKVNLRLTQRLHFIPNKFSQKTDISFSCRSDPQTTTLLRASNFVSFH
jgi:hypothetical protein